MHIQPFIINNLQPPSSPPVKRGRGSDHEGVHNSGVRFGCGRNNYCDCADCVAHPSRVIRLGVQSSWSGVDPVAMPRSSVGVHAPGTWDSSASGMSYRDAGFEAAAVTHFDVTAECGGAAAQDGPVCLQLLIADA